MRVALIVCVVASVSACAGNATGPSSGLNAVTATNIAGTCNGTMASSNNATVQFTMVLTQSASDISGSWSSTTVSWDGQISGVVSGSTFNGQLRFSGTAADGTLCTGSANVVGPAAGSTMTLTSASGVVGGSCPAPLPIGLKIDVQRQ